LFEAVCPIDVEQVDDDKKLIIELYIDALEIIHATVGYPVFLAIIKEMNLVHQVKKAPSLSSYIM